MTTNGKINGSNGSNVISSAEDLPLEKTDMTKVNYSLSRPGLLVDQLPPNRRDELAEHVGRRSMNRGMANPRLNKSR